MWGWEDGATDRVSLQAPLQLASAYTRKDREQREREREEERDRERESEIQRLKESERMAEL